MLGPRMPVPDDGPSTHRVMPTSVHTRRGMLLAVAVWGIGLAAFGLAWARLNTLLCDVVTYRLVWRSCAPQVATYLSPMLAVVAVGVLALLRSRSSADPEGASIEHSSGQLPACAAGLVRVKVAGV